MIGFWEPKRTALPSVAASQVGGVRVVRCWDSELVWALSSWQLRTKASAVRQS